MKARIVIAAWVLLGLASGCSTVPLTGRSQLSLISDREMLATSEKQYRSFLGQNTLSHNTEMTAPVQRVGVRIQRAVEQYFKQHGLSDRLRGYRWEFNLVQSKEVNAWCMPGGKVVVYTGILPVTQTEEGLAVVMGHEIAHAVAEHGNERMSQGLLEQLGGVALTVALSKQPQQTQQLWMSAYGAGAAVGVMLPYSRLQEGEADRLGLIFMAMAGYDPNVAVGFWQRMAAESKGKSTPAFLSTHPSDAKRIAQIRKDLPEAMRYFQPVPAP